MVSALPKAEASIVIDIEEGKIISGPEGVKLEKLSINNRILDMEFRLENKDPDGDLTHSILTMGVTDKDGNEIETIETTLYTRTGSAGEDISFGLNFSFVEDFDGKVIHLPINYYPNYLEDSWKIQIK